jgi:hypothetical protein
MYALTLAGDILGNALYYAAALALAPRSPWPAGATAGLLAGIGVPARADRARAPAAERPSDRRAM